MDDNQLKKLVSRRIARINTGKKVKATVLEILHGTNDQLGVLLQADSHHISTIGQYPIPKPCIKALLTGRRNKNLDAIFRL